jgi:hypothetical protein
MAFRRTLFVNVTIADFNHYDEEGTWRMNRPMYVRGYYFLGRIWVQFKFKPKSSVTTNLDAPVIL